MRFLFLVCLILPGILSAQTLDPWISYLICARDSTVDIGGALGYIRLMTTSSERNYAFTKGGVQLQAGYADYHRTGDLESHGASFGRYTYGSGYVATSRPMTWSLRIANEQTFHKLFIPWDYNQQSLTISQRINAVSAQATTEWRGMRGFAGMRLPNDQKPEPSCGLGMRLRQFAEVEALWQASNEILSSSIVWQNQPAEVILNGWREGFAGWCALHPTCPLTGELRVARYDWIRRRAIHLDATLLPFGEEESYHGFIALNGRYGIARAGLRGINMTLSAYGYRGNDPFAKITQGDANVQAEFVSFEHASAAQNLWLAEVEHLSWKVATRGHLEFWPFTSGLVDLLGLRRYFITETRGELWRGHLAIRGNLGKCWSGAGSIHLLDARLNGTLQHWQPEFLAFGKADEQWHRLSVYRVLGGMASITLGYHSGHAHFTYTFHQIVPIKIWQNSRSDGMQNVGTQPIKSQRVYGGALHQLSIGWSF
jgi:hypothetical protein